MTKLLSLTSIPENNSYTSISVDISKNVRRNTHEVTSVVFRLQVVEYDMLEIQKNSA